MKSAELFPNHTIENDDSLENKSMELLIPQLTEKEVAKGIEYSHIMLKPEAIIANPKVTEEIIATIVTMCEENGLKVLAMFKTKLGRDVVNKIYRKEIETKIIPEWELDSFADETTGHILVKGKTATKITARIKGKFVCNNENNCPYKHNLYLENTTICLDPKGYEVDHADLSTTWGSSCGIRGMLARRGIVVPDPEEINYTVYNWLHSPDPGQESTIQPIINLYNDNADKVHSLYSLDT